ncbi:MAG TPA: lipopolysaccharide biosynthesis protein [Candidatus Krumholzibacteria bacterium]|nr:lipopolysaccharide biosynthesis protein [Candidatus Krumholzibacteria bacterium]HPD70796.1 lipopolysaccharide biosynthesis protein [Candidatus Krumholzibacteria bacterium]HRY39504.1 lipopolysaccharide biosynthesis protein [Candidatus Krumholzibacteria bacterium]
MKAKVIRGVGWSALQNWVIRIISFAIFPVLARLLGPEAYGLIAMAGIYVAFLEIFSDTSFAASIEQRQDLEPEHLDSIFWTFAGVGLLLTGVSIATAPLIARFFGEPELSAVIRWLSLGVMMLMVSGVQTSVLRRDLEMRKLATANLVAVIVGGVLGIGMALAGFGVWSLVAQRLAQRAIVLVMVWRASAWAPRLRISPRHLRDVSGFGFSVMGNRVLVFLNGQFDRLVLSRTMGKESLGFYSVASRLAQLLIDVLIGGNTQVVIPALAKLQDDLPRFRTAFDKACRFTCFLALPVFAGVSLLAGEVVAVIFGPQWTPSVPAVRILALLGFIQALQYINSAAMLALGRANLRLAIQVVHTVVNVVFFLIAAPYGFVAVAAAYVIRAYLVGPLDFLALKRLQVIAFRRTLRAIRAPVVATAIMAAGVYALDAFVADGWSDRGRLLAGVALGAGLYLGGIALIERRLLGECLELVRYLRPAGAADKAGAR